MANKATALCLAWIGIAMVLVLSGIKDTKAQVLEGQAADQAVEGAVQNMESVSTLVAGFEMLTGGKAKTGYIFIDRQIRAIRMQFSPPEQHLLLVNGPLTQFFGDDGTELRTATSATPLIFLADPRRAIRDKVEILQVSKKAKDLTIAVAERGNVKDGQVILNFKDGESWRLTNWAMRDGKGNFSMIRLKDVRTNLKIDPALFVAPE